MKEQPTSVYIIACGDRVKIGVSINPKKRLRTMITGMPDKPHLVSSREFPTSKEAYIAERSLHRLFGKRRSRGEWFRISPSEAGRALQAETGRERAPGEASKLIADLLDRQHESPVLF